MAKKSIAQLHTTITAEAGQFVNELKRADNEARRSTASMRASVSKTMRDIQRDFSLPKLAKGVFAGFGIGGGMQLMDLGITKLVEAFQAGAKHAAEMGDAIEKMRKGLRDLRQDSFVNVLSGLDLNERPAAVSRELSYTQQLMEQAERSRQQAEADLVLANRSGLLRTGPTFDEQKGLIPDAFGGRYGSGKSMAEVGELAVEAQTKALDEIETLRKRIGELARLHSKSVDDAAKPILKADADAEKIRIEEREANIKELQAARSIEDRERIRERDDAIRARMSAGEDEFSRWASAGRVTVDDMTRRGLGTGADYKSIGEKTNSILSEILETTRQAVAKIQAAYAPRYLD